MIHILMEGEKGKSQDKFGICYYCDCMSKDCVYTKTNYKNTPIHLRNGLCIESYNQLPVTSTQKIQILYSTSRLGIEVQRAKNYFLNNGYTIAKYLL